MYTDGFVVAVVLGIVALLLPALWIAWWLIADRGERVSGTERAPSYKSAESRLHPAA